MGTSVSVLGRDGPLPESEGQQSRPRVLPAGQGKGEIAGDGGAGRPRLAAMKALAGFPWPAPPSLCHPASAAATAVVHAIAALHEEEGQAALVSALERYFDGATLSRNDAYLVGQIDGRWSREIRISVRA